MIESRVELTREGKGYFLFIGDDYVHHRWAVTKEELIQLKTLIDEKVLS